MTVEVEGGGSVNRYPHKASYDLGDTVALNVSPYHGYLFDGWFGGVESVTNPLSVTILGDLEITAFQINSKSPSESEIHATGKAGADNTSSRRAILRQLSVR